MYNSFSDYHPAVSFAFFAAIIGFTAFETNPVLTVISLIGAIFFLLTVSSGKVLASKLIGILFLAVLTAVVNLLFNHAGVTILAYLPGGNPLTLESLLNGLSSAVLLAAVVLWFACFASVMNTDKIIYLFGKIAPSLGLMLSMIMRFIPLFINRIKEVSSSRKLLFPSNKNKLSSAVSALSVMITKSLENAVETADSMKCRGWGLGPRSHYSIFSFGERDKDAAAFITVGFILTLIGKLSGKFYWRWFPSIKSEALTAESVGYIIIFTFFCFFPAIYNLKEGIKWRRSK